MKNLTEFSCTLCNSKLQQEVDVELVEIYVPVPRDMMNTLPCEDIK